MGIKLNYIAPLLAAGAAAVAIAAAPIASGRYRSRSSRGCAVLLNGHCGIHVRVAGQCPAQRHHSSC